MPNPEAKSNPSKRLPSASLATLRIHQGGCLLGFTPVSIHTQFRSSFSLTMVTSRHLSTFSLQTPPSTKMPLLLWLCFAQTPMPSIATVNNVLFVAAFKSIRSIPYLLNDCSFSLPLGCARSDTTFHDIILQARRNLIAQKNENLKSADNISTHVMGRARSLR